MQDPVLDNIDDLMANDAKDHKVYRAAQKNSRRVTLMKWALPLAAVAGLVWLGADLLFGRVLPEGVNVELTSTVIDDGNLVMANPEVTGRTGDDRPYRLMAERAIQSIADENALSMEGIQAEFELSDGEQARLQSPQGAYDRAANNLVLEGESVFITDRGMEIRFDGAEIDVETGSFATSKPVEIHREGTSITASTMRISDNGANVVFEGDVKLTIDPSSLSENADEGNQ